MSNTHSIFFFFKIDGFEFLISRQICCLSIVFSKNHLQAIGEKKVVLSTYVHRSVGTPSKIYSNRVDRSFKTLTTPDRDLTLNNLTFSRFKQVYTEQLPLQII